MDRIGVMVCGHGSRDVEAIEEFAAVARGVAERLPQWPVESGFLEFARPILRDGLDSLRGQGVTRVLAVPGMLFAAGHAKNDIPSVLRTYAAEHQPLRIDYARELAVEAKLLRVARERIEEAEAASSHAVPREETLLMVVGRGTSDPDANGNISKIARMLWEGMGFGWAEVCYSGVTFPLVAPGLEHAVKLGYRRIIVFPYFLFTGVLVKRIYRIADTLAQRHPEIEFLKAHYLNDHPLVLDVFAERVREILAGENLMNCALCKYREQVLGFEAEIGAPQFSHHHHVEGIGTGSQKPANGKPAPATVREWQPGGGGAHRHDPGHVHSHDHGHDHSHDHGHAHTHTPHPHAGHRHGPQRRNPDAAE